VGAALGLLLLGERTNATTLWQTNSSDRLHLIDPTFSTAGMSAPRTAPLRGSLAHKLCPTPTLRYR
jgi:hypothetical protein